MKRKVIHSTQKPSCLDGMVLRRIILTISNYGNKFSLYHFSAKRPGFSGGKFHHSFFQRKKRVVLSAFHVFSRMEFRAPLPNDNLSGFHFLAAEFLDSQPF